MPVRSTTCAARRRMACPHSSRPSAIKIFQSGIERLPYEGHLVPHPRVCWQYPILLDNGRVFRVDGIWATRQQVGCVSSANASPPIVLYNFLNGRHAALGFLVERTSSRCSRNRSLILAIVKDRYIIPPCNTAARLPPEAPSSSPWSSSHA